MQPVNPEDPRRPNVQIAAAIRAAILTGELGPGSRLPSGAELAQFFGVSRPPVLNAIRKLTDEGFVRTVPGGGVYVRDQGVDDAGQHPLAGMATFIFEMGHLKQLPRAGWLLLGVPQPETVAEHSFRVAIIGLILASLEGADVGRTTALCLLHDAHETRISDVPSVGRAYVTTASPEAVTAHQTADMPETVAKTVQELTAEYEAPEGSRTLECQLAHDADKLETLAQAVEYQQHGHDAEPWRETSLAALRTDAGRQLAQAIGAADPRWWAPFAASYHELRASTRASRPAPPQL
jgi:putative hydrolase of HD superfamily